MWNGSGSRRAKTSLTKENTVGEVAVLNIKAYCINTREKKTVLMGERQTHGDPRNRPTQISPTDFGRKRKNGGKTVFSTNDAGSTSQL